LKIIIDENLPKYLKNVLSQFEVTTVQEQGWAGINNGELIKKINGLFDVFITADKNLRYQQNLKIRKIAILEISTNRLPLIKEMETKIIEALQQIEPQQYKELRP